MKILTKALRIALIYLLLGVVWILYSDSLVNELFGDEPETLRLLQTFKGFFFVVSSSVIIYLLVKRAVESEAKGRKDIEAIFSRLPLGIAVNDSSTGKAMFLNRNFSEIYGWSEAVVTDVESFFNHVYPDPEYREQMKTRIIEDMTSGIEERMEWKNVMIHTQHGEQRFVNAKNIPLAERELMISTVQDVTELRNKELRLRQLNTQLRELYAQLDKAQEEEAIRISREIHDQIGQYLTIIKIDAWWVREHLDEDNEKLNKRLTEVLKMIDQAVDTVRSISQELRPPLLDEVGLISALSWSVKQFGERSEIACKFVSNVEEVALSKQHAGIVFRIVQESLTNILRHAEATSVELNCKLENDELSIEVIDNGKGFDVEKAWAANSLGLLSMKERTRSMNGTLSIHSKKNEGTQLIIRAPLHASTIKMS